MSSSNGTFSCIHSIITKIRSGFKKFLQSYTELEENLKIQKLPSLNLDRLDIQTVDTVRAWRTRMKIHWAREFMITQENFSHWFNPFVTISVASAIASKTPMKSINSISVSNDVSTRCKCISGQRFGLFERGRVISLVYLIETFCVWAVLVFFRLNQTIFYLTNDNDEFFFSIVPPLFVLNTVFAQCQAVSLLLNALERVQSKSNCVTNSQSVLEIDYLQILLTQRHPNQLAILAKLLSQKYVDVNG